MNLSHTREVVVTAVEAITGMGIGIEPLTSSLNDKSKRNNQPELADLDVRKLIPDRKMLKAISHGDSIALAAIAKLDAKANVSKDSSSPWRRGMYVSAQPSMADDNQYYFDAVGQAAGGVGDFGKLCMQSKPVALLIGLPNNVLCYGSMLLDAKGPNSNYTAVEHCGHVPLIQATRRLQWGKLDLAVAGGFNAHCNKLDRGIFQAHGLNNEIAPICDGAAFALLEEKGHAVQNGRRPLATVVASATCQMGKLPFQLSEGGLDNFSEAISLAIQKGGISPVDIGLVLAGAARESTAETCELLVLSRVFAKARGLPALGLFSRKWGDLMQASGIAELAAIGPLYELGEVPEDIALPQRSDVLNFGRQIDPNKPYVLMTKVSCSGQATCVLLRREN